MIMFPSALKGMNRTLKRIMAKWNVFAMEVQKCMWLGMIKWEFE